MFRPGLSLTLSPPDAGLVFGAILLISFGNLVGHWKWSLVGSWIGMTIFGGLMAMVIRPKHPNLDSSNTD